MAKKPTKETGEMKITEGVVSAESRYVRKTDAEVRKLAMGIHGGQVFVSWQLHEHEMNLLSMVFMPLSMMSELDMAGIKRDNVRHFYGYMKDAAPRSINGLPMFFSFYTLDAEDAQRIVKELKAIDAYLTGEPIG